MVEPSDLQLIDIANRVWSEIMAANPASPRKMRPGTDRESCPLRCLGGEMLESGNRAGQMRIVPPANEQHRQAHGARAKCRRYVVPVAAARRIIEQIGR